MGVGVCEHCHLFFNLDQPACLERRDSTKHIPMQWIAMFLSRFVCGHEPATRESAGSCVHS